MFVDNIEITQTGSDTRVSAAVAGEAVWFELPTEHFRGSVADALACFAFLPAMAQAPEQAPVTLSMPKDYPVSSRLLHAIPSQQDTFAAWGSPLQRFAMDTSRHSEARSDDRVASSFSGGVDSLFTAHTRSQEITHLVHIQGYELRLDQDPEEAGIPRIKDLAERLGKELIVVRTNALAVSQTLKIQRLLIFGCFMATVAHLVGASRFYVPSGSPLSSMANNGSSAFTDSKWSSESVELVHDINNFDRIEKMRQVSEFGYLDGVVVCQRRFDRNCCRCIKCVRTMIGIELQGLNRESFSDELTPQLIRSLSPLNGKVDRELFGRYLSLGRQVHRHDLVRAMIYAEMRYRLTGVVKDIYHLADDFLFGGRIRARREARPTKQTDRWFHIVQK
ncbi:MAG: hypothetical protein AAF541_06195 [Pseudomonadota bacterium]